MNPGNHDLTSQMRKAVAIRRERRVTSSTTHQSAVRQWGRVVGRTFKGAVSIGKTSIGIDRAADELVEARLDICRNCPGNHAVWKDGDVHTCGPMLASMKGEGGGTCGCVLRRKTRDRQEMCPFGWW